MPLALQPLLNVLAAITPAEQHEMAQEMLPRIFAPDDPDGQRAQGPLARVPREVVACCSTPLTRR